MKSAEQVSLEVGLTGGHVMLNIPKETYDKIKREIQRKTREWLTITLENGAEFELNIPAVQYLRMRPSGVRALSSNAGFTLQMIAKALNEPYDSLRQRIIRKGVVIQKTSSRRIVLDVDTITNLTNELSLNSTQVSTLKKLAKEKT